MLTACSPPPPHCCAPQIVRTRRLHLTPETASAFYAAHAGRFYFPRLVSHATSGPSVALALAGPDAIARWRALIGPTHVYKAQWERPETLRARYGLSDTRNGFHGKWTQSVCRHGRGEEGGRVQGCRRRWGQAAGVELTLDGFRLE